MVSHRLRPIRFEPTQKYAAAIGGIMKLQKQLSRRLGDREYAKWVIVLPPRVVRELGWKEGQGLKLQVDGKTLRMRPSVRGTG